MAEQEQEVTDTPIDRPATPLMDQLLERYSAAFRDAQPINPASLEQPQPSIKNELLRQKLIDQLQQRNDQRENL